MAGLISRRSERSNAVWFSQAASIPRQFEPLSDVAQTETETETETEIELDLLFNIGV